MMKSNLLHGIPPFLALVILAALWSGNRSAARELDAITKIHREKAGQPMRHLSQPKHELDFPATAVRREVALAEPDEIAPEALPPLVVPGTIDALGHAFGAMQLKLIELEEQEVAQEPTPGTPEFDAASLGFQEFMSLVTQLKAGTQILAEDLKDPMASGRCLAIAIGEILNLEISATETLAAHLGKIRKLHADGGEEETLKKQFLEESRDLLGEEQIKLLRERLGADFPFFRLDQLPF